MRISSKSLLAVSLMAALSFGVSASPEKTEPAKTWSTSELQNTLINMPKGDAKRGEEQHHALFCASCHGQKGEAPTLNWPSLAGQRAEYTYKMLMDYQSGLRDEDARSEVMTISAKNLTEQDMADLAAFYAAQELPTATKQSSDEAVKLVKKGDPARLITPCASCHGVDGQGGKNESPAIAGQTKAYFTRTMKLYHGDHRTNDNDYAMRAFAMPLTEEEITALADYFAPAK